MSSGLRGETGSGAGGGGGVSSSVFCLLATPAFGARGIAASFASKIAGGAGGVGGRSGSGFCSGGGGTGVAASAAASAGSDRSDGGGAGGFTDGDEPRAAPPLSPPMRASRIAAARSTRAFDFGSRRVKRSDRPGCPRNAFSLCESTRPSPRRTVAPDDNVTSKRRMTPVGRGCAPIRITLVFPTVSSSFSRNSSSDG